MAFIPAALGAIGSAIGGGISTLVGSGNALSVLGTAVSGISSIAAGAYANSMAKQQAAIAEENAKRAIERSRIEAQDQDTLTLGMLGEQEAAQSASGLSLTGKSQILTRKSARELGRRDALNVAQAGDLEAYNYRVEAESARAQGRQALFSGVSNALGDFLGGAKTLMGGARSTKKSFDPWITARGTNLRIVS